MPARETTRGKGRARTKTEIEEASGQYRCSRATRLSRHANVITHRPSGRAALLVQSTDLVAAVSGAAADDKFVLVALSDGHFRGFTTKQARACLENGASYICAWGRDCEELESTFDYAAFLPELGPKLPFTLMTTAHRDQPLEEALEFAFRRAQPPDDFPFALDRVVVVADTSELLDRCTKWLASENA